MQDLRSLATKIKRCMCSEFNFWGTTQPQSQPSGRDRVPVAGVVGRVGRLGKSVVSCMSAVNVTFLCMS